MTIAISQVYEYPIKGFPALRHNYATTLSPNGRIGSDRQWWFELADGTVVNGKWALREKCSSFFRIRADYDDPLSSVRLTRAATATNPASEAVVIPLAERFSLQDWMSAALERKVILREDARIGRPDDLDLPSFTLMSEASVAEIGDWFDLTATEVVARLRPNLLVNGVEAFEEYSFLGREMEIAGSRIFAAQACMRCSVPPADPLTGVVTQGFAKRFGAKMAPMLRQWAPAGYERDSHGFYASINTRAIEIPQGARIESGQTLKLL